MKNSQSKTVELSSCKVLRAVKKSLSKWKTLCQEPKSCRPAFGSLVKLQIVKWGNVLRVKLSARNEKQTSQSTENLSFAGLLWLPTTDGTIYSWGLRASFLSSRTAVVAGCTFVCPHGNPNWYIVFVSNRVSCWSVTCFIQMLVKAFFVRSKRSTIYFVCRPTLIAQ